VVSAPPSTTLTPGIPNASAGYVGGITGIGGSLLPVDSASAGIISGAAINARPVTRPGEVLEAVPGLIVTQHSGEGKANQYFLRGFNLDHGTDIAISVDGMPVNMRTHAHGQGYADLNFLIPELVGAVEFHKGPYFVRDGDFASAGSVRIDYLDTAAKNVALTSMGSFGYKRALSITTLPLGEGNLLVAGEAQVYDGPWVVPDALRKINGVARYSQGTALDGFSITGMAYAARWTATNQIPERAVVSGQLSRYGTIDPTDGGDTSRFSLSARFSATDDTGVTRASAYLIRYQMNLFNDFTYFLNDPVSGDQFHQLDQRILGGGEVLHIFQGDLFGRPLEVEIGAQTRTDSIRVGLFNTTFRQYRSGVLDDRVLESSGALYLDTRLRWTEWLRTSVGVRADGYFADVRSDTPANSGKATDGIVSPKLGLVLGPWFDTEIYVNYGGGFHSNDARGVTATVDPASPLFNITRSPFLVPSTGYEVGVRNRSIAGLETSLALFRLDFASENIFQGDTGTTEPSRPTRRFGIEWTNRYAVTPWLSLEGDLTITNARFSSSDLVGNHHRVGRRHVRRTARLVRILAVPLFRAPAADRGQCDPLAGGRARQRPGRIRLQQRDQRLAGRAEPDQQQVRPDHLRVCLTAARRARRGADRPGVPPGGARGRAPDHRGPLLRACLAATSPAARALTERGFSAGPGRRPGS
jgi:hypothetical protein